MVAPKQSNAGMLAPHLVIREHVVPPAGEWQPPSSGWWLAQVVEGDGYGLQPGMNQELAPGTTLLLSAGHAAVIRASHLGALQLRAVGFAPRQLGGLLSLQEQTFFQTAALRRETALRIFPPAHPVAEKMRQLGATPAAGLPARLHLLLLLVEAFGEELNEPPAPAEKSTAARDRLGVFLRETPASELLALSFRELARRTHCTPRHLSRIFQEVVGMSFRDKRAELRLARARELLATSDSKIVDIALESGYRSLSVFNLMFSRRFGLPPGQWSRKHRAGRNGGRRSALQVAAGTIV